MFENPFEYYTDPVFWALYFSVTLLTFLSLGFIGYTFTIRVANRQRQNKREHLRDKYADKIYAYLTDKIKLEQFRDTLSSSNVDIPIFFDTVKQLKDQLKGEKDEKLDELLKTPFLQDYYYEKLDSVQEEEIIKGLLYFRELNFIEEKYYQKLLDWVESEKDYLAHAAASVLLSTKAKDLHLKVLKVICTRAGQNYRTIIEILWDFWSNEKLDYSFKLERLKKVLNNEKVHNDVKALIIRSLAEFGYKKTGQFILELLDKLWDRNDPESMKDIVISIINALRRLEYLESISTIEEIVGCNIPEIERACIRALSYFKTDEAIQILQNIAEEGPQELLKELSFQMNKYPQLQKSIRVPVEIRRECNPNYAPLEVVQNGSES